MKRGVPEAYHDVTVAKKPAVFLRFEIPLMAPILPFAAVH
jgi:hypothetical protein